MQRFACPPKRKIDAVFNRRMPREAFTHGTRIEHATKLKSCATNSPSPCTIAAALARAGGDARRAVPAGLAIYRGAAAIVTKTMIKSPRQHQPGRLAGSTPCRPWRDHDGLLARPASRRVQRQRRDPPRTRSRHADRIRRSRARAIAWGIRCSWTTSTTRCWPEYGASAHEYTCTCAGSGAPGLAVKNSVQHVVAATPASPPTPIGDAGVAASR